MLKNQAKKKYLLQCCECKAVVISEEGGIKKWAKFNPRLMSGSHTWCPECYEKSKQKRMVYRMKRHFEDELKELKERLLYMGSLVEARIHQVIKGLVERDEKICHEIATTDDVVNSLHLEVDERCLNLLALRQPIAIDLRFITSAMKINSDLERIGDLAVNIGENCLVLLREPFIKPLIDVPRMAAIAEKMLKDSLDAFVSKDVELGRSVILRDDEVDALKDQVFRDLLTYMIADANTIPRALNLILVSRHLERIADHATNIAEDVIYMVLGKDIRHHAEEK